ncbi:MAG TPA: hypothetical protein PKG77_01035 [Phycisphaerae bacterium]|nr:hypothetical protein [Phycisphaerae bacterium]HQL74027.1 hypothetical protein [Phycisphaerae bacterium]
MKMNKRVVAAIMSIAAFSVVILILVLLSRDTVTLPCAQMWGPSFSYVSWRIPDELKPRISSPSPGVYALGRHRVEIVDQHGTLYVQEKDILVLGRNSDTGEVVIYVRFCHDVTGSTPPEIAKPGVANQIGPMSKDGQVFDGRQGRPASMDLYIPGYKFSLGEE